MCACFRIGAVVLPCNEQLRAKDLRLRIETAQSRGDRRRRAKPCRSSPRPRRRRERRGGAARARRRPPQAPPAPAIELDAGEPCLITFTSGTSGEPKAVAARPALPGRPARAGHAWLGARRGDLVWCTAAAGWTKSARNAFIAPWLSGAGALLHDARFDPGRAPGAARARAGQRALHGAHRVPGDRQARDAAPAPRSARHGRRRRGAESRGPARLARGDGALHSRRVRADRDRSADRAAGRAGAARIDGTSAARRAR